MDAPEIDAFIARWGGGASRGGNERANLQLFLTEFCTLLDLPQPDPASADTSQNAYVFERAVTEHRPDGSTTSRALDLYRRGCFVLEGKDTGKPTGSETWEVAIIKAHKQAENYVRALPGAEGRPPFILVVDVGRCFVLWVRPLNNVITRNRRHRIDQFAAKIVASARSFGSAPAG